MRVVVTRPEPQASRTARRLADAGHAPILAPLLSFRALTEAVPAAPGPDVAGLVLTSQNAVRAIAAARPSPDLLALPAFAVGAATAKAARAAGFSAVDAAAGDAAALAARLAARPELSGHRLLHPCGRERTGDLPARLAAAGIGLEEAVVYEMEPAARAPAGLRAAARGGADAVLVYSPRTARVLERLVAAERDLADLRRRPAVALSAAVARPLEDAGWNDVRTAARPEEDAVMDALAALARA